MNTIYERALDFVHDGASVGLGSGRAASEFIRLLGQRVREGMRLRGCVATSNASENLARAEGLPIVALDQVYPLDIVIDGADEWTPRLDLIKGYGRAMVREKIVEASSRKFIVLVGPGKAVKTLGERGKLPIEVIPLAVPLVAARIKERFHWNPVVWQVEGKPGLSDNGNHIIDCAIPSTAIIDDPAAMEAHLVALPGVVGTGLFPSMADVLLEGDEQFELVHEHVL
jgi:ribose 5-phosphate isomerase A